MKINYLRRAWLSMCQQPLVSVVSVAGTTFAIFLIMVVVMLNEVGIAPYPPESNRERWLVQRYLSIKYKDNNESNGCMSYATVKAVMYEMTTPEAVTAFTYGNNRVSVSVPGSPATGCEMRGVDAGFWKVMDFTFLQGAPFTQDEFESGVTKAVISDSMATKIFHSTGIVGRDIRINYTPYRVCGVVKDVTNLAPFAFADIWVPFSSTNSISFSWNDYMGPFSAIMLAKDKKDFKEIREEYDRLFAKLGDEAAINGKSFVSRGRPYTQKVEAIKAGSWETPDVRRSDTTLWIVFMILLIVPAVNLSSMTQSRLQQSREEIGVRRAFGTPRYAIAIDILIENMLVSLFAGAIGLILSLLFIITYGSWFLIPASDESLAPTGINIGILFHWTTFGWALLFCFLLNLMSSGLPSFQAARTDIVKALEGK